MRCNQCEALMINGLFCHEIGCPNTYKDYDKETGEWVTPEPEEQEEFYDEPDEDEDYDEDDWRNQDPDLGGTGHGDISWSDADPGL